MVYEHGVWQWCMVMVHGYGVWLWCMTMLYDHVVKNLQKFHGICKIPSWYYYILINNNYGHCFILNKDAIVHYSVTICLFSFFTLAFQIEVFFVLSYNILLHPLYHYDWQIWLLERLCWQIWWILDGILANFM